MVSTRFFAFTFLLFIQVSWVAADLVGACDDAEPPMSWAFVQANAVVGIGSSGGVTAGQDPFCYTFDNRTRNFESLYHLNSTKQESKTEVASSNHCVYRDSRIILCYPECASRSRQNGLLAAAVTSTDPQRVADAAWNNFGNRTDIVIQVITLDSSVGNRHVDEQHPLTDDFCKVRVTTLIGEVFTDMALVFAVVRT